MSDDTLTTVLNTLADLRGYSGVGEDGNPYDTLSWNAALVSAQHVIKQRLKLELDNKSTLCYTATIVN